MAIYPGATFKPTTWGGRTVRNKQGRGILHVAVSERVSYPPYSGNTWHFYVAKDGYCEQYVDTEYRAYASVDANDDALSIETAGAATPATVNTEPWTAAQCARIADIMRWESQQPGGAPLQLLPDAKPGRTGWGPHRLGIKHSAGLVPGWWFPGCEVWSSALGKECPGDAKVRQVPQIIELARNGTEDDMLDPNQAAQLARADTNAFEARKYLGILEGNLHQQIGELQGAVASLAEAVSRLQAGGAADVKAIADLLTVVPKG